MAEWLESRTCDQEVAGSNPDRRAVECNPGQVVLHTRASVTKQYNLVPEPANGRWCSAAGEVTAGLTESNGSLPPGLCIRSPAGWLPRTGISSGTLRSFPVWHYLHVLTLQAPLRRARSVTCFCFQLFSCFRSFRVPVLPASLSAQYRQYSDC